MSVHTMSIPRPGYDYCPQCYAEQALDCMCKRYRFDELYCPQCGHMTSDGEWCGECISERASYYYPDEGGQG